MKYIVLFIILIVIGLLFLFLATTSIGKSLERLVAEEKKNEGKDLPFFRRIWHSFLMGFACFEGIFVKKFDGVAPDLENIVPIEGNIFTTWSLLGLYLFVLILFLPIPLYIISVAATCLFLYLLKNRSVTQIASLALCLLLIKFSLFILLFAISHIPHTTVSTLFAELAPYIPSHIGILLLGVALAIICHSLAAPIIMTGLIMNIESITLAEGILMLAGVHLGLALYLWVASFTKKGIPAPTKRKRDYSFLLGLGFLAIAIPFNMMDLHGVFIYNWMVLTFMVGTFTIVMTSIYVLHPRLKSSDLH